MDKVIECPCGYLIRTAVEKKTWCRELRSTPNRLTIWRSLRKKPSPWRVLIEGIFSLD